MTSSAWQDDDNVAAPCGRRRRQGNVVICRMWRRLHHRHAWRRHRYIRHSTAISHLLANYYTKLPQWRPKLWWCGAAAAVEATAINGTATAHTIKHFLSLSPTGSGKGKQTAAGNSRDSHDRVTVEIWLVHAVKRQTTAATQPVL